MESMTRLGSVLADLRAAADDLDRVVADLDDEAWATPTPSPGWTIARQITHLDWTDERAALAVTEIVTNADGVDPAGVAARLRGLAGRLWLDARVAYFDSDELTRRAGGFEAAWRGLAHTQAKAVGEWLWFRDIDIPAVLL